MEPRHHQQDNRYHRRPAQKKKKKNRRSRSYSPVASRLRRQPRTTQQYPPMPASSRSFLHSRSRSSPRSRSRSPVTSRRRSNRSNRSRSRRNGTTSSSYRRERGFHPARRRSDSRSNHRRSRDRSYRKKKKPRYDGSRQDSRRREYHQSSPWSNSHGKGADERDASDDSAGHDDTIGSYEGKPGDYIASRYKIIREAGLGTFGRVLECLDKHRDMIVAIKVVRKVEKYTESAKIEASILEDVNDKDERNESLCVRLYKWFEYKGHVCLVFERLGCSLYEYLKSHDYKPFPMRCIQAYAWQLLVALEYIHSIKLIHTDLKPENILLVDDEEERLSSCSPSSNSSCSSPNGQSSQWSNGRRWRQRDRGLSDLVEHGRVTLRPPAYNAVKLIDFGGATYDDESKSSIINTRQYRSPEVILGLGWSFPSDIWSAGCIIAELYLGELLFATHENLEHLALIEKCIGRLPEHMVASACKQSAKFFRRHRLDWPDGASSQESVDHVRKMRTLEEIIGPDDAETGLLDLLQLMLVLDPAKRITAKDALNHPFFDGFSRKDITSMARSRTGR